MTLPTQSPFLRVPGAEALGKFIESRKETRQALARGQMPADVPPVPDALLPEEIPSVATLGKGDRVIAEIDQDGYAFAVHADDVQLFNRREKKLPRLRYKIDIVLHRGAVCVRKQLKGVQWKYGTSTFVWSVFDLPFYNEAAAMIRLRQVEGVPHLRDIDESTRTLYTDYVRGPTLQQRIAEAGAQILDADGVQVSQMPEAERNQREIDLFRKHCSAEHSGPIADLVTQLNEAGVAPLDVKLGNIIVGDKTGRLYWIDFERAHLSSAPRYRERLAQHRRLVHEWFGVPTT